MGQNDKDEVFTLKLDSIPSVTTNLKLIICASAPQSNGIIRAYSKAAEFIAPQTPVTTAIALKSAYDQKYGAPSTGAPKGQSIIRAQQQFSVPCKLNYKKRSIQT